MSLDLKYKSNLQKFTEFVVGFGLPILVVLVGLGLSTPVNNLQVSAVILDYGFLWNILFLLSLVLTLVDSFLFGQKINAIVTRSIYNLGKICTNSLGLALALTMDMITASF